MTIEWYTLDLSDGLILGLAPSSFGFRAFYLGNNAEVFKWTDVSLLIRNQNKTILYPSNLLDSIIISNNKPKWMCIGILKEDFEL